MNIIEKIINLWRHRGQKALPKAQMSNSQNKNINKIRKYILQINNNSQPTKLDMEIDNFLKSYSNIIENVDETQPINTTKMAYDALVTMQGKEPTQEEYENNDYKEQELLKRLYSEKKYNIQYQGTKERTVFYHIKSKGYKMPQFENIVRLYINCNNGNISELSNLILSYNQNPNFYMKFISNEANDIKPRGEKIVIYCDKNEVDNTMQLIRYTKSIRPDLYTESENILPFLLNIDNMVSASRQPLTNQFDDLYGNYKTIPQSTNSFLSMTLKESYMEAAKEIARADTDLSFLLQNECINDEYLYMKNYPYINSKYHDYLIQSMEAKMAILAKNNDLYIDGIPKQYQQNIVKEEKNNQYNTR